MPVVAYSLPSAVHIPTHVGHGHVMVGRSIFIL